MLDYGRCGLCRIFGCILGGFSYSVGARCGSLRCLRRHLARTVQPPSCGGRLLLLLSAAPVAVLWIEAAHCREDFSCNYLMPMLSHNYKSCKKDEPRHNMVFALHGRLSSVVSVWCAHLFEVDVTHTLLDSAVGPFVLTERGGRFRRT